MTCCALPALREEMASLSSTGREALLLARSSVLVTSCIPHASALLVDLTLAGADSTDKVAPAVFERVILDAPLEAVRCAVEELGDCQVYTFRYLLARLLVGSLLPRIAAVRDGTVGHTPYANTLDGPAGLAFDLASGFDRFSRARTPSRFTSETTLMLGAARDPQRLYSEFCQVRILQRALLNEDPDLLAWALANPRLVGPARRYTVGLSSAAAVLSLFEKGVLDDADLAGWTASRQEDHDLAQLVSVFLLDGPTVARTALANAVLQGAEDPLDLLRALPSGGRLRALEALGVSADSAAAETSSGLLDGWSGSLVDLLDAARRLGC